MADPLDPRIPGAEIITQGLVDLAKGATTIEALLVAIGAPRLRRVGIPVPDELPLDPELVLYGKLCEKGRGDAHSAYNAWIGRLTSCERELERRATPFAT
jgi:hypothetical protein